MTTPGLTYLRAVLRNEGYNDEDIGSLGLLELHFQHTINVALSNAKVTTSDQVRAKLTCGEIHTLVLVDIESVQTIKKGSAQTSVTNQHYNLLVVNDSDNIISLFEPLRSGVDGLHKRVVKFVRAFFPNHKVDIVKCHPQLNNDKDVFCLAYVCRYAIAIAIKATEEDEDEEEEEEEEGKEDGKFCTMVFDSFDPAKFVKQMSREIDAVPVFPTGAAAKKDSWFERHTAATLAGTGGLLFLGPIGAVAGIVGGEVLHDKGKRETGNP